jgi:hypothetical protein
MNKKIKVFGIALMSVLALAVLGAGFAFAQTSTPPVTPVPGTGYGPGRMMGGYGQSGAGRMGGRGVPGVPNGMMGGSAQTGTTWASMDAMHQWMTTSGGMHTFVWNALAEKLGLTSDKLTAEVNSGKTIAQLAEEKGLSRADLVTTLETAHQTGLAQAVKDGALTQAQADSIATQMAGRYEWMLDNMGQGGGRGGQYGAGRMMNGQAGMGGCGRYGSSVTATPAPKP